MDAIAGTLLSERVFGVCGARVRGQEGSKRQETAGDEQLTASMCLSHKALEFLKNET